MSTRPPPPRGTPVAYSVVTRYFKNLRPVVIGTSIVTAIWSISAATGFYRNIGPYNDNGASNLATISIIIGSIYMGVFAIGLFGIFAAVSRKLLLVRIFAYLSALAVIMVSGINLFRVITHFTMRKAILDACTNVATGETFFYGGWWGPVYSDTLTLRDAQRYCTSYYDRDSWYLIIFGFLLLSIIGIFFSMIAFAFLHQTLDPLAPGNVMRDPQRTGFTPGHYSANAPYNTGFGQGYPNPNYAPPPGPPPFPYPDHPDHPDRLKPPGYNHDDSKRWEDLDMQKQRDEESGPKTGDARF